MRRFTATADGYVRLYEHFGSADNPPMSTRCIEIVRVETASYDGHEFREDFHARQDWATGPGWYVFARNGEKYGRSADGRGSYVKLVARPAVKPRRHPHYSCKVERGFRTKAQAEAVATCLALNFSA